MSISKIVRPRARDRNAAAKASRAVTREASLPLTASRSALLDNGSDKRFRQLVYDLLTIAARMGAVREHLGRRMGLSGPQYSFLMATARVQGREGVSVGALARILHVSSAFVAMETGKLVQAGLVAKRSNPRDRRAVLITLTRLGRSLIERNSEEIRAINDVFFGSLDANSFNALSLGASALVHGSGKAVSRLAAVDESRDARLTAAE